MKNLKINIVIPSITISAELIHCLEKMNQQTHKNFFVTIVLDYKNKNKLPKLKYKLNVLTVGKKNMSYKRNLGVKKFKSDLIGFIDSDTFCHKNWIRNAIDIIYLKKKEIIGGPNIPFPNQKYNELLCYKAKRSFFVTGYLNFRKFKTSSRYCDWLESCNLIMYRKLFIENKGMNENIYVGEDKEFQERLQKNDKSIKVFYSPKLFIYHKERSLSKFLMQRLVFGLDLFNITNFGNKISSFQPILPLLVVIIVGYLMVSDIELKTKIYFTTFFIFFVQISIIINISTYIKKFSELLIVLIIINLANLSYSFGSILRILHLHKFLDRRIYLKSRNNQ